jgi:adenine deaminase
MMKFKISGNIIDIENETIFKGEIEIEAGRIKSVITKSDAPDQYVLPGFIDAHVHIESSMIIPSEFARMAVVHGTVATVSDPHEIGNVLGIEGVEFMINNGKQVPFKFFFGAPSCVPATTFETAGATIDEEGVDALLSRQDVWYLAEMMNWPGVLYDDPVVRKKIAIAKKYNKVVDGHAPGLRGENVVRYASAGISTDHECFTAEEALDKLKAGMKIIIREGSAAKNFDALVHLIDEYPDRIMFCSDDKHPDSLEDGHINQLVKRALAEGLDLFKVLRVACINPIDHYGLPVGRLRVGDPADFICVNNPVDFRVLKTFVDGQQVADEGRTLISSVQVKPINRFLANLHTAADFRLAATGKNIRVIEALDGQLVTNEIICEPTVANGNVVSDPVRDILKIVVVNRYKPAEPAVAFIKNFNLKSGAIASSVGHDSHNIISVGVSDEMIARAVNLIVREKGGISVVGNDFESIVPLPVAGIMSGGDGYTIATMYKTIDAQAKQLGSTLSAPFMTLSFMALLVIPALKLSDKGLFDGNTFTFADVFAEKKIPPG